VGGLEDTVGINILVAATGHSKGITGFSLGRVDILVAKVKLTELILSMELAGGNRGDGRGRKGKGSSRSWSNSKGSRGNRCRKSKRSCRSREGKRCGRSRECKRSRSKRSCKGLHRSGSSVDNLNRSWNDRGRSNSSRQHWSRENRGRSSNMNRGSVNRNRGSMSYDRGKGNFVISINGFCFSISLLPCSNSFCSSSMGSKVFSFSGSNLRSINHRFKGSNKGDSRYFRGNWEGNIRVGSSNRKVGGSNSESIDRVGDVVGGLEDTVGINILVAATGHSKGITGFSLGRVDILVAKVKLTELILSMELAGGN